LRTFNWSPYFIRPRLLGRLDVLWHGSCTHNHFDSFFFLYFLFFFVVFLKKAHVKKTFFFISCLILIFMYFFLLLYLHISLCLSQVLLCRFCFFCSLLNLNHHVQLAFELRNPINMGSLKACLNSNEGGPRQSCGQNGCKFMIYLFYVVIFKTRKFYTWPQLWQWEKALNVIIRCPRKLWI
jgi:hypothetical protein